MEAFCFSVPDTKDARSLVLAGGGSLLQAWLCQAPTVVKVPVCCGCPSRWAQSCLLQGAGAWLRVILRGGKPWAWALPAAGWCQAAEHTLNFARSIICPSITPAVWGFAFQSSFSLFEIEH